MRTSSSVARAAGAPSCTLICQRTNRAVLSPSLGQHRWWPVLKCPRMAGFQLSTEGAPTPTCGRPTRPGRGRVERLWSHSQTGRHITRSSSSVRRSSAGARPLDRWRAAHYRAPSHATNLDKREVTCTARNLSTWLAHPRSGRHGRRRSSRSCPNSPTSRSSAEEARHRHSEIRWVGAEASSVETAALFFSISFHPLDRCSLDLR